MSEPDFEKIRSIIDADLIKPLLVRYSEWLEEYGYMDSDWWSEPPNAVDRFLEKLKNQTNQRQEATE